MSYNNHETSKLSKLKKKEKSISKTMKDISSTA